MPDLYSIRNLLIDDGDFTDYEATETRRLNQYDNGFVIIRLLWLIIRILWAIYKKL